MWKVWQLSFAREDVRIQKERGISALPGDWWVGLGTGDERASMPWDMKVILSFGLKRGLDMHTD